MYVKLCTVQRKWKENFFSLCQSTRSLGHLMKEFSGKVQDRERKGLACLMNLWNSLPQDVGMATGVDDFNKTYVWRKRGPYICGS